MTLWKQSSGNTIGKRLVKRVLLIAGLLTIVFSAMVWAYAGHHEQEAVFSQIEVIQQSHLDFIRTLLRANDTDRLESELDGISRFPGIEYAVVNTRENTIGSTHGDLSATPPDREYPVARTVNGVVYPLGTLQIKADMSYIVTRQIRTTAIMISMVMVIILLLCLAVLFLIHHNITRHLVRLTHYASDMSLNSLNLPWPVEPEGQTRDEMDVLAITLSQMSQNLYLAFERQKEELAALNQEQQAHKAVQDRLEKSLADLKSSRNAALSIMQDANNQKKEIEQLLAEREKIHQELVAAKEAAEQANRAKSEFLSTMSHELRTPLNAVIGFSQVLGKMENDPKKRHYLNSIHTSGNVLLALINDILDLSKIEAGKLNLVYTVVNPAELIKELFLIFSQKAKEKDLDLALTADPALPAGLILDESRIRQVCLNLLSNALKFTEKGRISLDIKVDPKGGLLKSCLDLVIVVRDTGIGIPEKDREKIFDAFHQAKHRKGEKNAGTGLGLAITTRLVRLMGGYIRLESHEGKGAVFRVHLPGVEIASAPDITDRSGIRAKAGQIAFEPARILVVDDIDYNREILVAFLEPHGFEFLEAKDGREALDLARRSKPDLILLDMKMPVMDGYDASKQMKHDPGLAHIPIIAITADAMKQDEKRIFETCDGFLPKPCRQMELVRELMKVLPYKRIEKNRTAPEPAPDTLDDEKIRQALALLSQDKQAALKEAVMIVHADGVKKVAAGIFEADPGLARSVEALADQFDFEKLSALLPQ